MELAKLESIIATGLGGFREAGKALLRVKKRRLYAPQYASWDDYCRRRWGFTARRANQLIAAARHIGQFPGTIVPANEGQARELLRVPSVAQRQRILQQFSTSRRPTAQAIRQARQELERLSPAETFQQAQAAEERALGELERLDRQSVVERIMRLCGRLSVLHGALPCAEKAGALLRQYQEVIQGTA